MFESVVLGAIQGVAEWLPVSSEGLIILAKNNFFGGGDFSSQLSLALFLHLGTFLAALVYFRKEVKEILATFFKYRKAKIEDRALLKFLLVSTIISGFIGLFLYETVEDLGGEFISSNTLNLLIGIMLLVTGYLQLKARSNNKPGLELRDAGDAKHKDGFILGVAQGFAALPGLSRSGLTVAFLLLQRFKEETALRMSFLMSLPIVLGGNLAINYANFDFTFERLIGLIVAFVFGYLTIDWLLKIAKRVNFGKFVIGFGVLTILATLI